MLAAPKRKISGVRGQSPCHHTRWRSHPRVLKVGCWLADKKGMRALSIRQPYAELILRGTCGEQIKPIEFRSRRTWITKELQVDRALGRNR